MFSDLNNLKVLGLMDSNVEYFGFNEEETEELFHYYGLELCDEVRDYYDGYYINKTRIFNPWSILNYVESKELKPYWINTSGNRLIKRMLRKISPEYIKFSMSLFNGEKKVLKSLLTKHYKV